LFRSISGIKTVGGAPRREEPGGTFGEIRKVGSRKILSCRGANLIDGNVIAVLSAKDKMERQSIGF